MRVGPMTECVWRDSLLLTLAFQHDSQPRLKSSQEFGRENKRGDANQIVFNTESAVSLSRIVIVLTL